MRAAREEVRGFCAEGRALFALVCPGLLRTPEVDRILEECRQDLDAQDQALSDMEEALARGAATSVGNCAARLREAATRLAQGYGALHGEETKEKVYSPFPVLDHFLKVGLNVLEGHVGRGELAERFPPVVALVGRLERDVARFSALYEAPEVAGPMAELVGTMQAGLGALVEYFELGSRPALADGLKLLGRGSAAAHEGIAEMDRRAASCRRNAHPYLEELHRSLQRHSEGRLSWLMVQDAWQLVQAAARHYRQELEAFRRFPLYPFLEADEAPARAALQQVEAELARLDPAFAQAGRPEVSGLEGAFSALSAQMLSLWDRIEEEMARYSEAPHFEELRERVGRALSGEPPEELLHQRLVHFHAVQQELAGEALSGGLEPALATELSSLLAAQDEAYQVMLGSLEGRDLALLRRGWEMLEATMPCMLQIARDMRQALQAARPAAPARLSCLRCGQENAPGTRYCRSCNAVLPEVVQAPTEYTDIMGGGPAGGETRLSLLEDLLSRAEGGQVGVEEILAEVSALEHMAGQVARTLVQQVGPAAQGQEAEFAARFREQVESYLQGLEWIRDRAAEADVPGMWRGLEACRVAGEEIASLKGRIDAVLAAGL